MKALRFQEWSERQQIVAVILMAGVVIFLLWFFALTPLNSRRRAKEEEIRNMESQLARKNYNLGEDILRRKKAAEHKHNRQLHAEWVEAAQRLSTFTNRQDLANAKVGIIDFQLKLFAVRQSLLRKSRALDIELPYNLGIERGVRSDEDARQLMLQLLTIEKLVDLMLDLKINEMRSIEPLPPIMHKAPGKEAVFLEEYPIRFKFFGKLENIYDLFHAVLKPDQVFTVRHLRIEAENPDTPDILTVSTVMSSLLFVKNPDDVFTPPRIRLERPRPMGY